MSLVWRKIQRSNKKAAKFKFTADFQELLIQCSEKWQPKKVCVSWVHRRRKYSSKAYRWEPSITDPLRGLIVWPSGTETLDIVTTLYRDTRLLDDTAFEDKEWTFIVEEVCAKGRNRPLASVSLNLRLFLQPIPGVVHEVKLKLRPLYHHVQHCVMQLLLSSIVLREGDALDDDIRSEASELSVVHEQHRHSINTSQHLSASTSRQFGTQPPKADQESFDIGSSDFVQSGENNDWETAEARAKLASMRNDIEQLAHQSKNAYKQALVDVEHFIASTSPQTSPIPAHSPQVAVLPGNDKEQTQLSTPAVASTPITSEPSTSTPMQGPTPSVATPSGTAPDRCDDLLSWCQQCTAGHKYRLKINNFSSSWRNGMAFCALIDYHRRDLLKYEDCHATDIRGNCEKAFNVAHTNLGVPKIIDVNDMLILLNPDKLTVMAYVHSLRQALTAGTRGASTAAGALHTDTATINQNIEDTIGRHSLLSLSATDAQVLADLDKLSRDRPQVQDASNNVSSSASSSTVPTTIVHYAVSHTNTVSTTHTPGSVTRPTQQSRLDSLRGTPLMSRKQLTDPFDSDDDSPGTSRKRPSQTPAMGTEHIVQTEHEPEAEPVESVSAPALNKQQHLKERAKQLLHEYDLDLDDLNKRSKLDMSLPASSSTAQNEVDSRRRELRERARRLIAETQREDTVDSAEQDVNVAGSSTNNHTNSTAATAHNIRRAGSLSQIDMNTGPLRLAHIRRTETLSPRTQFYQFRRAPSLQYKGTQYEDVDSSLLPQPHVRTFDLRASAERLNQNERSQSAGRYRHRQHTEGVITVGYPAHTTNHQVSTPGQETAESPMDRFKRYGSMRRAELSDSINLLSDRLGSTIKSSPNQLTSSRPKTSLAAQTSVSHTATGTALNERAKVTEAWQKDLATRQQIEAAQESVAVRMQQLTQKANHVEQELRALGGGQDTPQEKALMNEFLQLINERNLLLKRESYLNVLNQIRDYEQRFVMVQTELGQLLTIDESSRLEAQKQQIDRLMEQLITLVNKKDELAQQLIAIEQETEEEASNLNSEQLLEMQQEGNNCVLM